MFEHEDTLDDVGQPFFSRRRSTRLALVVAWSTAEPGRVGEVALLRDGEPQLFGRGDARDDDPAPRVELVRQRPGTTAAMGPLTSLFLSRRALLLEAGGDAVSFSRVGRNVAFVNGEPRDRGQLRPGDVLRLDRQLVLVCCERPAELPIARAHPPPSFAFGAPDAVGSVGESPVVWALRDELALHAAARAPVLLLGPSGTGKELAARTLHALSPHASRPLVARNASTLPDTLVDAELFGNARNYPNPGMRERPGLVGEAEGSTLFLDEIGEAPHAMHAHLLRLLDQGDYYRLGESTARRARIRFVAATNRPVSALKHDLAARFTVRIELPPLQRRREDIPLLLRHMVRTQLPRAPHLARFVDDAGEVRVDTAFVEALLRHPWTLHVRELEEIIGRAAVASPGDSLMAPSPLPVAATDDAAAPPPPVRLRERRELPSFDEVVAAMERHGGNRAEVCRELGLRNRFVLYRLLKREPVNDCDDDDAGASFTGDTP